MLAPYINKVYTYAEVKVVKRDEIDLICKKLKIPHRKINLGRAA